LCSRRGEARRRAPHCARGGPHPPARPPAPSPFVPRGEGENVGGATEIVSRAAISPLPYIAGTRTHSADCRTGEGPGVRARADPSARTPFPLPSPLREGCAPAGPRTRRGGTQQYRVPPLRGLGAVGNSCIVAYGARSPTRSAAEGHAQTRKCQVPSAKYQVKRGRGNRLLALSSVHHHHHHHPHTRNQISACSGRRSGRGCRTWASCPAAPSAGSPGTPYAARAEAGSAPGPPGR
jgi:hypothetical protein